MNPRYSRQPTLGTGEGIRWRVEDLIGGDKRLLKRFAEDFERGFGCRCAVIGPPENIAHSVLAHDPLAFVLVIRHIEWMTQRHHTESARDDQELDPQFKSLLEYHWMEEAQPAELDLRTLTRATGRDWSEEGILLSSRRFEEVPYHVVL